MPKRVFVVESFYGPEFKLDTSKLENLLYEYKSTSDISEKQRIRHEFMALYPECTYEDLSEMQPSDIPKTIKKKIWFVQPNRDINDGHPLEHFSLKSRLLTGLRNKRKAVKKQLGIAKSEKNTSEIARLNAKQLAIKIIMNTEYGASGNKIFAHYDPDIAAAVTYLSRTLIGFLTKTLHGDTLYVDSKFISDNQKYVDRLSSIGCITSIAKVEDTSNLVKYRRMSLRRLFDDYYNVVSKDIQKITIARSVVLYQDTDSNYYINPYIREHYESQYMTPMDVYECMVSMIMHNEFMSNFAACSIHRAPVGLSFEGAFIIARYFHRKKKYYGKQYEPGMIAEVPEGEKWNPKKVCEPLPNGDYIYIDDNVLLHQSEIAAHGKQSKDETTIVKAPTNYLDYVKSQGIKCTGVNLARRDQYKFINYYHIVTIQQDMHLIHKNEENKWELFQDHTLMNVITSILERFQTAVQT